MREKGWSRRFLSNRSALPGGGALKTLKEAVAYLARTVPKGEQGMPEVLAAADALTNAAEREVAWMFLARIATLRAIRRNEARMFNPNRKDTHWESWKLKRDE